MDKGSIDYFIDFDLTVTDIIAAYERQCPADWTFRQKTGRLYHGLIYVLDGKAVYYIGDQAYPVEKGHLIYRETGSQYWVEGDPADPFHFIVVHFSVNDDHRLQSFFGKGIVKPSSAANCAGLFQDLARLWFYKGIAYKMKCKGLLTEILFEVVRQSVQETMRLKHFAKIQAAVSYMERYSDHPMTLEELAAMSHLSVSHFRRIFKEIYRMPPVEYLNFIRVNKAKDLIMSRMYPMGEIAAKVGYPNLYYFSRVFKQYTGLSPTAYERIWG